MEYYVTGVIHACGIGLVCDIDRVVAVLGYIRHPHGGGHHCARPASGGGRECGDPAGRRVYTVGFGQVTAANECHPATVGPEIIGADSLYGHAPALPVTFPGGIDHSTRIL